MRRKPYSVILFDEIEKAHPDVFNILLQILEDGILTDSQGRRIDFKNSVIIMTSNAGARLITEHKSLGFGDPQNIRADEAIKSDVMGELKRVFRPEFLNRVDDIIVFHQLTTENIKAIAYRMLEVLNKRLISLGIDVTFDDLVVEKISKEGFDTVYGARPLRRAIQHQIEDKLSEKVLEGTVKTGEKMKATIIDDKIEFMNA